MNTIPGPYPIELIRRQFPALRRKHVRKPVAYFDGPGGSQAVSTSIDAMAKYLRRGSANLHGQAISSLETGEMVREARSALGDLLHVDGHEIAFGANATSLLFHLSRSLGRDWQPGDEVVVTELDHRGNVDPWLTQAQDKGATVRWIPVDPKTLALSLDGLDDLIGERTRLVAVGLASNAVGKVTDVARIAERAHAMGALVVVDAVHAVPHFAVDAWALGADVLVCSAHKAFGPHLGIVALRAELFRSLETYRVMSTSREVPDKLETGALNHEAIAGLKPAVEFIASLGTGRSRRDRLMAGYGRLETHENRLAEALRMGLAGLPRVRLHQPRPGTRRTPTIAFTVEGLGPAEVCRQVLERASVFISDGHFHATTLAERLGVGATGGWVRAGIAPYSTDDEVARFLSAMGRILR